MSGIQMMVMNNVQPLGLPGPILYLDATDYSGSGATWPADIGSDATLINAPAYTAAAPTFFTFNGTDEAATTGNLKANFASSTSQTLEIWVRTASDDGVVISQTGTSTIDAFYHLSVMEIVGGDIKMGIWNGTGIGNVTVGSVARNQWQQYVLTYDDATNTLTGYINAGTPASTTFENDPPTPGWFYHLCATDSTNMGEGSYLAADVGLFRVWDTALTASQVQEIYQQNTARFNNPVTANLVLNLDAADYSGSGDWLDTSGNSNDAALQGTPAWNAAEGGYFDLVPAEGDWFSVADAASLDSMSEITIEIWINLDTVNAAGPNMLFSKRATTSDGYVGFLTTTGYTYRFGTGTGTGLTYSTSLKWRSLDGHP